MAGPGQAPRIKIVEQDGSSFEAVVEIGDLSLVAIANVRLDGRTLVIYDFHVDGPGPGALGWAGLRGLACEVLEIFGAEALELHGFRRTTGANPGHVPRPIRFTRDRCADLGLATRP